LVSLVPLVSLVSLVSSNSSCLMPSEQLFSNIMARIFR
jgi:hypothetical protein